MISTRSYSPYEAMVLIAIAAEGLDGPSDTSPDNRFVLDLTGDDRLAEQVAAGFEMFERLWTVVSRALLIALPAITIMAAVKHFS